MNKFALVAIAGVLSTSTAFAADLGYVNQAAPAAAAYTSASNWTGFYAGINGGYGWAETDGGISFDDYEGIFGGAQVGYNYDFGGFVLGVEGDIQLSDIGYEETVAPGFGLEAKLDYFGTVRARAGYAFDGFLPYVTGGLAFGGASIEATTPFGSAEIDDTFVGFTVGGGLEVAVTDNVSVKGEYLYTDFGSADFDTGIDVDLTSHVVRLGVNYRF